jgi:ribonuclease PH
MTRLGIRTGDIKGAAGSSYVELNGTKLFAAVYGPIEPDTQQESAQTSVVDCLVEDAWDSSCHLEGLQHKIQHTFSATICQVAYFKTLIRVAITILNQGSSLSDAATLAGSLALLDAGIQMTDFIVSCTVGLVDGEFIPFAESATSVRVAILSSKDEIVETEVVGKVHTETVVRAVNAAVTGCKELTQSIRSFLKSDLLQ